MGGIGSGRWHNYEKRYTVEDCLILDINRLMKAPVSGVIPWTQNGKQTSSMGYEAGDDGIRFRYAVNNTEPINYYDPLTHTHPDYGGLRCWFVCPECDQKAYKLYKSPTLLYEEIRMGNTKLVALIVFTTFVLSISILMGCVTPEQRDKEMNSMMGLHKSEIIFEHGPPSKVASDGKGGEILIYETVEIYHSGGYYRNKKRVYEPLRKKTYVRRKMFYVDDKGIVYHWKTDKKRVD